MMQNSENNFIENLKKLRVNSGKDYVKFYSEKRNSFVMFSPTLIEKIWIEKQRYFDRGILHIKLGNFLKNGILTIKNSDHLKNRRAVQKSFDKKYFDSFSKISYETFNELFTNKTDNVCINKLSDEFAIDSISQYFLNTKFNDEFINAYHEISFKSVNFSHLKFSEDEISNFNKIRRLMSDYVKENDSLPFIKKMLESGLTQDQVIDEALTVIGAGFETTGSAIFWTIFNLLKNDKVLNEIRKEDPEWIKEQRAPKYDELFTSELLNNVIKETLRMYPPIYFITRIVSDNLNFDDLEIEKYSNVFFSQYITQRDEKYYDNPEEWNPYRWTKDFEKNLEKGAYFPFGYGSRKCIGEYFAKTLIYMFVSMFVSKYGFELIGEPPKEKYWISLLPDKDVYLRIIER